MAKRTKRPKAPWWEKLPTEELLDVRLCDLGLRIPGTTLERRIDLLHDELGRAGLVFRPYVWLSTDWFTPEGSTGFAVPFYLAHMRLVRLEHAQMFEAEGSTHEWCMKLLRHEAGHAMDNAYRLHQRADWRRTFGRYSAPYRTAYQVRPMSKHYVQHLGAWYAQSHPAEDYAETFAVWMAPNSRWQTLYEGWPARNKLEQLDKMLRDIGDQPQPVRTRDREESLPRQKMTLREFYRNKQALYGRRQLWRHDSELRLVFEAPNPASRRERAATFLRDEQVHLRNKVSALTGQYRYVVDQAIGAIAQRCRELDLRLKSSRSQARLGAAVLTTMVTIALARGHQPRFRR
ncbi:MAG TPA: putative zinc-binding metallopeptidase [Planctomycetota bacterium]|nr:putative zinc-binding metallopeptidase [Planctomycetota bacterium]